MSGDKEIIIRDRSSRFKTMELEWCSVMLRGLIKQVPTPGFGTNPITAKGKRFRLYY